jgi:subtilisin family serine protease
MPDSIISGFSSHGPTYDGRIKPDVSSQGDPAYVGVDGGYFTFGSGTSFSSPIIAGMSACLWQAHPSCSNMEIIEALRQNGSHSSNPDNSYGWGIPNFGFANLWLSATENPVNNEILAVYPNPVINNDLYIITGWETVDDLRLELFDQSGRLIRVYLESDVYLNGGVIKIGSLGNIKSGLYLIRIINSQSEYDLKFIR